MTPENILVLFFFDFFIAFFIWIWLDKNDPTKDEFDQKLLDYAAVFIIPLGIVFNLYMIFFK